MTWLLRPCPRCGGNVYRDSDDEGENIVCLQCGAVFYPEPPLEDFRIARRRAKGLPTGERTTIWGDDD